MTKHIRRISNEYRSIFIALLIVAVVGTLAIAVFAPITGFAHRAVSLGVAESWQRQFDAERDRITKEVEGLAKSDLIRFYLRRNDTASLLAYTSEEAKRREIWGTAIMSKDGLVLSRTAASSKRGDYISETTVWGATVAAGKDIAAVEAGATVPMLFVAGEPVVENGEYLGGVFSGYTLDNAYARTVRDKHFGAGSEIVFLSAKDGITGSSFEDPEANAILESHLLAQAQGASSPVFLAQDIQIGGQYYIVSIVPLMGSLEETGKVLIFTPDPVTAKALLFAALIALCFILAEALIHQKFFRTPRRKGHLATLIILSAGVATVLFVVILFRFARNAPDTSKPFAIYNSTIAFSPDANIVGEGVEQKIAITVTSGGEAINAAKATIHYDPAKVEVLEISTERSFCNESLLLEKNIDATAGRVEIACVTPAKGWKGRDILAELLVKPLSAGAFTLKFADDTAVFANDGLGTNVLRAATNGNYQVVPLDLGSAETSFLPLYSPTHPNSTRWYRERTVSFAWPSKPGRPFEYHLDAEDDAANIAAGTVAAGSVKVTAVRDGTYIFHLAVKDNDTLKASYQINIDSTPPKNATIKASTMKPRRGDVVRFEFSATDEASGIQSYYVKIDNGLLLPVRKQLLIPFFDRGTHTITLRVFDQANNYSDTTMSIRVQ